MNDSSKTLLAGLNPPQAAAVQHTEGPVLILAGAGSGKTRVLVHRIAYLIDEADVFPSRILAITFTNKAAGEMRSRVNEMIGFGAEQIMVSTFHSFCARLLREFGELLGYTRSFSIYDADDQLTVMKRIFKEKNVDSRYLKERGVLHVISSAKNELKGPDRFAMEADDFYTSQIAPLYKAYQNALTAGNAVDFDDLIMLVVRLFETYPDVLMKCQERWRYLMIDEYQDTNAAQFRFVSLMAQKYRNLCVVGDDDQSIYRFRGADIGNILNFEEVFPDAYVIRLEQNYRSTKTILNAANEVIRHNHGRKDKRLWTENEEGGRIRLRRFENGYEEAEFVASDAARRIRSGQSAYKDIAVLYRTNAQSRIFEEKFLFANIPYRIVGGVNFYARKEIKDILAYLKTVSNGEDDLAVRRIINIPKRGIGGTTLDRIGAYAEAGGISFLDAVMESERIPGLGAAAAKRVAGFASFIKALRSEAGNSSVSDLIRRVVELTEYEKALQKEGTEEAESRMENIDELISKAAQFDEDHKGASLEDFLSDVALVADIDSVENDDDRVLLMTLHSAKGLEFPVVYMAGMEEMLFPSAQSITADSPEDIEEERRLCYVGITRARSILTMTCAKERMVRGETQYHALSRFVREIPRELVDVEGEERRSSAGKPLLKPAFGKSFDEALHRSISGHGDGSSHDPSGSWRNPYSGKAEPESGLPLEVGDRVRHAKFGEGKVLSVTDAGRDYSVEVDFTGWGVKKMMAAYAHLEKL